jgi:Mlc titration factor MtfA (ptsG expression regulator)
MEILILIAFAIVTIIWFRSAWLKIKWNKPNSPFPPLWRTELAKNVAFYNSLNEQEKKFFEYDVQEFLLNCKITGVDTTVTLTDKILIASSAVIPIFAFPEWKYLNLQEVLVYPDSFNRKFSTNSEDNNILGMVGNGYLEGKMILSQKALRLGFSNITDKNNTAIHEFIHLIDKMDGKTDGIPQLLLDKQYSLPWLKLIHTEINRIKTRQSDINPYGATDITEFLAVAGEYFFEKADLMQQKHPELYNMMEKMFKQKMSKREFTLRKKVGRNALCPCGSGKKYKYCCGKS